MSQRLRVVFAGTPAFAAEHLRQLLETEHEIVGVYTQPDRPAGRGRKLQPSTVKQVAIEHEIPVYQPESFKTEQTASELQQLNADVMVVVAYGLLLPRSILDIPRFGCINVHGSLLPRWRGAAPIQRAIWAGDKESGVAIMQMEAGLDTGPVLLEERCAIDEKETSASLYQKLETLGPRALVHVLSDLQHFATKATTQDESQATYARKLIKEEGRIDWRESAVQIERNIRAFFPWPTAWFDVEGFKGGQSMVKVLRADVIQSFSTEAPGTIVSANADGIDIICGTGTLRIIEAQVPGKKPQAAATLVNGYGSIFYQGKLLS